METCNLHIDCRICEKDEIVSINNSDFEKHSQGKPLEKAFPYLTAEQREMIRSRVCKSCWDIFFLNKVFGKG